MADHRLRSRLADPRLTIARRELAVLKREKVIVLALLLQLFIAAFSSFLVVGLVSLYSPSGGAYTVDVGVAGEAGGDLAEVLDDQEGIDVRPYPTEDTALAAFHGGDVQAVLAATHRDGRLRVQAIAPDSNVRTTVVVVQIREALQAVERHERRQRAGDLATTVPALPPGGESSPYYGFTYTALLPLLLFLPVFISGSIAVDSMTEEIRRGTLELLRVAPVSTLGIVEGKLLAAVVLAPAQAVLWLGLLHVNGTPIHAPGRLLALVVALALVIVSLGVGVALPAGSRSAAQLLFSTGTLFLFGVSTMVPENPGNVAARLAIGSGDVTTDLAVVGYLALGVASVLVVRRYAHRVDVEAV